jgi:hypothetical protein
MKVNAGFFFFFLCGILFAALACARVCDRRYLRLAIGVASERRYNDLRESEIRRGLVLFARAEIFFTPLACARICDRRYLFSLIDAASSAVL